MFGCPLAFGFPVALHHAVMDRLLTNTYRDGFAVKQYAVHSKSMGFSQNPVRFDVPPCGLPSLRHPVGLKQICIPTPTCLFGPPPRGIESFPHGNDVRQVHQKSMHYSDTRFFDVELSHFSQEMSRFHIDLNPSDVGSRRRRFISRCSQVALVSRRVASGHSDIAPLRTDAEKPVHEVWTGHIQPTNNSTQLKGSAP